MYKMVYSVVAPIALILLAGCGQGADGPAPQQSDQTNEADEADDSGEDEDVDSLMQRQLDLMYEFADAVEAKVDQIDIEAIRRRGEEIAEAIKALDLSEDEMKEWFEKNSAEAAKALELSGDEMKKWYEKNAEEATKALDLSDEEMKEWLKKNAEEAAKALEFSADELRKWFQ